MGLGAAIIGFVSALIGAVLSPIATHYFDRRRRRELRMEERVQEMKRMLQAELVWSTACVDSLLLTKQAKQHGTSAIELVNAQLWERAQTLEGRYPGIIFREHRIDDEELRRLAIELHEIIGNGNRTLREVRTGIKDIDGVDVAGLTKALGVAADAVDRRMSEMDW